MTSFPEKLSRKLKQRREEGNLRCLPKSTGLVDFSSNDYLGFARRLEEPKNPQSVTGSSGSRLISGNHPIYEELEAQVATFHQAEAALIFNSGYDANLGVFSALPQRTDYVFYDASVHASIRDGLSLSPARTFSYPHNDLPALAAKVSRVFQKGRPENSDIYLATESVFSMEGDGPDLSALLEFCQTRGIRLILDEAHAVGVVGPGGSGLAVELGRQDEIFARVVTFGKALGVHGAAVLGSKELKEYLVNFSRSLIYTTALPPGSLQVILNAYERLAGPEGERERERLQHILSEFETRAKRLGIDHRFTGAHAAIRHVLVGDSTRAAALSKTLADSGFDVRAIRPPTVAQGAACLRLCLHSYNQPEEIQEVLSILANAFKERDHEQ